MEHEGSEPVTELLLRWRAGDEECLNRLLPPVEGELRRIAHRYMRMERQGHTLQTTALVNEAYLKLVDQAQVDWQNRAQFLGVAARLMRHILVDHARGLCRGKRGGGGHVLPLDEALVFSPGNPRPWSRWTTRSRIWRFSIRAKPRSWSCVTSAG